MGQLPIAPTTPHEHGKDATCLPDPESVSLSAHAQMLAKSAKIPPRLLQDIETAYSLLNTWNRHSVDAVNALRAETPAAAQKIYAALCKGVEKSGVRPPQPSVMILPYPAPPIAINPSVDSATSVVLNSTATDASKQITGMKQEQVSTSDSLTPSGTEQSSAATQPPTADEGAEYDRTNEEFLDDEAWASVASISSGADSLPINATSTASFLSEPSPTTASKGLDDADGGIKTEAMEDGSKQDKGTQDTLHPSASASQQQLQLPTAIRAVNRLASVVSQRTLDILTDMALGGMKQSHATSADAPVSAPASPTSTAYASFSKDITKHELASPHNQHTSGGPRLFASGAMFDKALSEAVEKRDAAYLNRLKNADKLLHEHTARLAQISKAPLNVSGDAKIVLTPLYGREPIPSASLDRLIELMRGIPQFSNLTYTKPKALDTLYENSEQREREPQPTPEAPETTSLATLEKALQAELGSHHDIVRLVAAFREEAEKAIAAADAQASTTSAIVTRLTMELNRLTERASALENDLKQPFVEVGADPFHAYLTTQAELQAFYENEALSQRDPSGKSLPQPVTAASILSRLSRGELRRPEMSDSFIEQAIAEINDIELAHSIVALAQASQAATLAQHAGPATASSFHQKIVPNVTPSAAALAAPPARTGVAGLVSGWLAEGTNSYTPSLAYLVDFVHNLRTNGQANGTFGNEPTMVERVLEKMAADDMLPLPLAYAMQDPTKVPAAASSAVTAIPAGGTAATTAVAPVATIPVSEKGMKVEYVIETPVAQKGVATAAVATAPVEAYCLCRMASSGNMVGCDASDCPYEWFHFSCVGMTTAPKGVRWYCPACVLARRAKGKITGTESEASLRFVLMTYPKIFKPALGCPQLTESEIVAAAANATGSALGQGLVMMSVPELNLLVAKYGSVGGPMAAANGLPSPVAIETEQPSLVCWFKYSDPSLFTDSDSFGYLLNRVLSSTTVSKQLVVTPSHALVPVELTTPDVLGPTPKSVPNQLEMALGTSTIIPYPAQVVPGYYTAQSATQMAQQQLQLQLQQQQQEQSQLSSRTDGEGSGSDLSVPGPVPIVLSPMAAHITPTSLTGSHQGIIAASVGSPQSSKSKTVKKSPDSKAAKPAASKNMRKGSPDGGLAPIVVSNGSLLAVPGVSRAPPTQQEVANLVRQGLRIPAGVAAVMRASAATAALAQPTVWAHCPPINKSSAQARQQQQQQQKQPQPTQPVQLPAQSTQYVTTLSHAPDSQPSSHLQPTDPFGTPSVQQDATQQQHGTTLLTAPPTSAPVASVSQLQPHDHQSSMGTSAVRYAAVPPAEGHDTGMDTVDSQDLMQAETSSDEASRGVKRSFDAGPGQSQELKPAQQPRTVKRR